MPIRKFFLMVWMMASIGYVLSLHEAIAQTPRTEPPLAIAIISPAEQEKIVQAEPFITIAKRGITQKALATAIAKLTMPVKESASFWNRIANSALYPIFQRRSAVEQLFRRHVYAGMSLFQLSKLLDKPKWLKESDIRRQTIVLGQLPVDSNLLTGMVFTITAFYEKRQNRFFGVYIRIPFTSKPLRYSENALTDFQKITLGTFDKQAPPEIGSAKISELGYVVAP